MTLTNHALIKAGAVENIAVVDSSTEGGAAYLEAIAADCDSVVDLTSVTPQPGIGWVHNPDGSFAEPTETP